MGNETKFINRLVEIIDNNSQYHGHWGFIRNWDGNSFHVSGGSISSSFGELTPIFDRDQLRFPRTARKLEELRKRGASADQNGKEIQLT